MTAKQGMISSLDWENTSPAYALGFKFDIVLRGREATPMENK
jgi:protocatechuate 3,4-dioxygenase beta subunit